MKLKSYLKESKIVKDRLNFVMKNQKFLNDWDVDEIWGKVVREKFKEDTGFYGNVDRYKFTVSQLGFETDADKKSYEEILNEFKEFMKKSSLTGKEAKEKQAFDYIVRQSKYDGKNKFMLYGSYDFDSFIRLLRYAILGKLDSDLGPAIKTIEGLGIHSSDSFRELEFPELNVKITKFKNRNVIVKGLPKKAVDTLNRIYFDLGIR